MKLASTFLVKLGQANYGKPDAILPFACQLVSVTERHSTAESTAGTLTLQIVKAPSGTAIGSGANALSAGINMKATADTNQAGSLSATVANTKFAAGDSVGAKLSTTVTELAGSNVTLEFKAL